MSSLADKKTTYDFLAPYAKKLGYTDDDLMEFKAVLETIQEIMEKAQPMEWDKEGVKLENGKVVLPGNMESVLHELIRDNELYRFFVPEKFGGYGWSTVFLSGVGEVVAKTDISLHILEFISLSVLEGVLMYYREEYDPIIEKILSGKAVGYVGFSEPEAGSNLENVKTTSEKDGDEYVINGKKVWISNGGYAEVGLVLAQNIVNGKQEGHNVFVVDGLKNIKVLRLEEKMGLHANPTAQLLFEDVRVPEENLLFKPGEGYTRVLERLMGMRVGVALQSIAAAQRAYELAKEYAENRIQFKRPIIQFDGVSRKLREMEKALPYMKELGARAAYHTDRYLKGYVPIDTGATGHQSELQAAKMLPGIVRMGMNHFFVSQAKLMAAELAWHIIDDAVQIHGGNGFVAEYEVDKLLRDVRVTRIYEGTSEVHEFIIYKTKDSFEKMNIPIPKIEHEISLYEKYIRARFPMIKNVWYKPEESL